MWLAYESALAGLFGLHAACGKCECIGCHGICGMVCKSLGGAQHNTLALILCARGASERLASAPAVACLCALHRVRATILRSWRDIASVTY